MGNEDKIISLLESIVAEQRITNQRLERLEQGQAKLEQRMDKLEQRLDKLDQRIDKLEQRVIKLELEVSRIRTQQQEDSAILRALRHAVEAIDARGSADEISVAKLDRLEIELAKHEGKFVALKEAVS